MNTACPSEERLKSLIMEAFDELSAPESARITQIGSTLANKTKKQANQRPRPRHHWLFWLLLGGSVTAAAWWGGSIFITPKQLPNIVEPDPAVSEKSLPAPINRKKNTDPSSDAKETNKDSSIIYQRELY